MRKIVTILLTVLLLTACSDYEDISFETTSTVIDKEYIEAHTKTTMVYSHVKERMVTRVQHVPDKWYVSYIFKGEEKHLMSAEFYNLVEVGDELKIHYVERWKVKKNGKKKSKGFLIKKIEPHS